MCSNECEIIYWWNEICNCDWSGFIPTMIATFVGFILAIVGTWIYDSIKEKDERKSLVIDLKNELWKIRADLNSIFEEDQCAETANNKILRINPLKCYIWNAALSTGKITLLDKKNWYSDLLKIYNIITDFNEWQLLKTTKILEDIEVEPINMYLEKLRVSAIERIDMIVINMDKY